MQSLTEGQQVIDRFAYAATDGIAAVDSFLDVTITGVNDAPVVAKDAGHVAEDSLFFASGNVLANDSDVDAGTVLAVASPGQYVGTYGTLSLSADGSYTYELANDSLAVQSLGEGVVAIDRFTYAATDGYVAVNSILDISVTGLNDAPVTTSDVAIAMEDLHPTASGNVLANDHDVDAGTQLRVASPGTYVGAYGSLSLAADGSYTYALDNASLKIQSLGREALVVDHFSYTATDGLTGTGATLDVLISGHNDAPIVAKPLADQNFTFNKPFTWQVPAGSFTDVDQGDVLTYSATLADGSALPGWVHFDAQTQTFYGITPKAEGYVDVRVTATDKVAASGSTEGSLAVSDVFRLTVSHGNQGVGNGQDAAPAGQTVNFNDGAGTSPGNPGAKSAKIASKAATGGSATAASVAPGSTDSPTLQPASSSTATTSSTPAKDQWDGIDLGAVYQALAKFDASAKVAPTSGIGDNVAADIWQDSFAARRWSAMEMLLEAHKAAAEEDGILGGEMQRPTDWSQSYTGAGNVLVGSGTRVGIQAFQSLQGLQEGVARLG